jgi:hypothetical protein
MNSGALLGKKLLDFLCPTTCRCGLCIRMCQGGVNVQFVIADYGVRGAVGQEVTRLCARRLMAVYADASRWRERERVLQCVIGYYELRGTVG